MSDVKWTVESVRALGVVTSLDIACSVLDVGRTKGHQLAREDRFPVPVLKVDAVYKVPVAGLLAALGIDPANANGAGLTPAPTADTTVSGGPPDERTAAAPLRAV